MTQKIITDNNVETIRIIWDGTRFILIREPKVSGLSISIILNPREMMDVVQFASNLGDKK